MHRILFGDITCPQPYDGNTLQTQPQGGSESTLTRVAEALASQGHQVRVAQHNRLERTVIDGVEYVPARGKADFVPTHVVAFRTTSILNYTRKTWPEAKSYVWYQDFPHPGAFFHQQATALARDGATPVLVSDWHEELWRDHLRAYGFDGHVATRRIYNAIPDDLHPDGTPVDRDKFVFFSSPHKGLAQTLRFFSHLGEHPDLRNVRLYVANPGYSGHDMIGPDNPTLVDLGPLSWGRVIQEVRSAFLVLHYNPVYPETFGLVHAEADAVGTPWISGKTGANPEVCCQPDELADLDDPESVIDRIIRWRTEGRPEVRAGEQFRLSRIAAEWQSLFDGAPASIAGPLAPRDIPASNAGGRDDGDVVYVVERGEIEGGDTSRAADFFARLTADHDSARAHRGKVDLRFASYAGESRPVWEIPEARAWLAAVDEQVPSWFWFLPTRLASDSLLTVMLSLCAPAGPGRTTVDPGERAAFMETHFERFVEMSRGIEPRMVATVDVTQQIARYYGSRLPA